MSKLCGVSVYRYCPECKTDAGEVIQAGEKMRLTKKKANMQSKKGTCQRDWGKVQLNSLFRELLTCEAPK